MMIITICVGSSCHLKGSREVIETLEKLIRLHNLQERIELNGSFCMDHCVQGVCVRMNEKIYSLTPKETEKFFEEEILGRLDYGCHKI